MKKITLERLASVMMGILVVAFLAAGCKKDNGSNTGTVDNGNTGVHNVDPRLVGKWMWTKGSDMAYYSDNGVYTGSAYGLARQYTINADGSGTCFSHVYSTLGAGSTLEVNISYKGFFESDDQGHMGFFPTSGTYKSTSGENRSLRADELWNTQSSSGTSFLYQKVVFTTQDQRACFQVTASNGVTDTFYKVP